MRPTSRFFFQIIFSFYDKLFSCIPQISTICSLHIFKALQKHRLCPVESLVKPILSPFRRNSFATALASYFTEWDFFRASSRGDERIRETIDVEEEKRVCFQALSVPSWKRFPATAPLVWKTNDPNRPLCHEASP